MRRNGVRDTYSPGGKERSKGMFSDCRFLGQTKVLQRGMITNKDLCWAFGWWRRVRGDISCLSWGLGVREKEYVDEGKRQKRKKEWRGLYVWNNSKKAWGDDSLVWYPRPAAGYYDGAASASSSWSWCNFRLLGILHQNVAPISTGTSSAQQRARGHRDWRCVTLMFVICGLWAVNFCRPPWAIKWFGSCRTAPCGAH